METITIGLSDYYKENWILQAPEPAFQVGSLLNATIVSLDHKKYLDIEGKQYALKEGSQIQGQPGDRIQLLVADQNENGYVLKQMDWDGMANEMALTKEFNPKDIYDAFFQYMDPSYDKEDMQSIKNLVTSRAEAHKEQMAELREIKNALKYAVNNSGRNMVNALLAKGISPEKIGVEELVSVIQEITGETKVRQQWDALDAAVEQKAEVRQAPEDMIAAVIKEHQLPDTEKNRDALKAVADVFNTLKQFSEGEILNYIRAEKPLTLENVYISKFTPVQKAVDQGLPFEMEAVVSQLFERENIQGNEENRVAARELIRNDLPATKETIHQFIFLQHLEENVTLAELLNRAGDILKTGYAVLDIPLDAQQTESVKQLYSEYKKYKQVMRELRNDAIFEMAIKPFTLKGLYEAYTNSGYQPEGRYEAYIQERLQVYEIQLRLTQESAYRLAQKNIDISTMPLQKAIDQLKEIQNELFEGKLALYRVEPTEQNVAKMAAVFEGLQWVNPLVPEAYGAVIRREVDFSIDGVTRAMKRYDLIGTKVNPKFHDSFAKIQDQFAHMLEENAIIPTEENIRAAQILTRNHLEITEDLLTQVKMMDVKLTAVEEQLHPHIAARMIREGLNPAQMHVDEILSYIHLLEAREGIVPLDSVAESIYEMDQKGEWSETEREAVVGIYRMLSQVQKNGGAAIGMVLKAESGLTLNNLMESSKYYQNTRLQNNQMDVKVNESFGMLESAAAEAGSIREILEKALEESKKDLIEEQKEYVQNSILGETAENYEAVQTLSRQDILTQEHAYQFAYSKFLLDQAGREVPLPSRLATILEELEEEIDIEEFYKFCKEHAETGGAEALTQRMAQTMAQAGGILPEVLFYMNRKEIPSSLQNARTLHQIAQNPFILGESLSSVKEFLAEDEAPEEEVKLQEDLKLWQEKIDQAKNMLDITEARALSQLQFAQKTLEMAGRLSGGGEHMLIPYEIKGEIKNVNLYILQEEAVESGIWKGLLSLKTEHLGTVSGQLAMQDEQLSLMLLAENDSAVNWLNEQMPLLVQSMEEAGFAVKAEVKIAEGRKENTLLSDMTAMARNLPPYAEKADFEVMV